MKKIFTDGSCKPSNPGFCGIGVVVLDNDIVIKKISNYLGNGTNNIAELTAIKVALEYLEEQELEWEDVELYTDSGYAVGLLTKNWSAKKNIELVKEIRELLEKFPNTNILWVKGHNNNEYNELADELANAAVDKGMNEK